MQILMIEDDKYIVEACKEALSQYYEIDDAQSIEKARQKLTSHHYQLILLDIQLPDGQGIDFIQEIRKTTNVPIIFISVYDEDDIISRGLDLGADDYIIKPFSLKILLSRINSVLRRYYGENLSQFTFGNLVVDIDKKIVRLNGDVISLTPIETELFMLLIQAKGKILSRRFLLETVWDRKGEFVEDNTLTVTIKRLKDKIGSEYIKTKRNVGYYFEGGIEND